MADFALLFDAPDHSWAEHVQSLIQQALGERGTVSVGLPGEASGDSIPGPGYVVTGVAVCDEPEDEMLDLITGKLADYAVDVDHSGAITRITVAPAD